MFSITDRWNRTMSCGTTAIAARRLSWVTAVTGWPSTRTSPQRTSSSRWTSAAIVDLPDPDGPARPTFCPAEPRDQRGQRRLAGPGRARQADLLPGRDAEAQAGEDGAAAGVGEGDVAELDPAAGRHEAARGVAVGAGGRA